MPCCHYYEFTEGRENIFTVDFSSIKYGAGALAELGADAKELGLNRVAIYTDERVRNFEPFELALNSLRKWGIDYVVYDEVRVDPTDASFRAASAFAFEMAVDGFISIGGGSVIDTCKAANLYSTHPASFATYVNAPLGDGQPVPGVLKPHIACPTTSGTGSECTGVAVFDFLNLKVKTGIASRWLRPQRAVIDPSCTRTLPANVVAASGFDVLSHALESLTARPYTMREKSDQPGLRAMSQGANPYSDMGSREALRLTGRYLERAVHDAEDAEARQNMMFAATLAGIAFGNCGVHIPHGMSYSVAGLVRDFQPEGYPAHEPICPHGMSVIVNAPSAFRFTARACPDRHLEGARLLGADIRDATPGEAGEVLAEQLIGMMRNTRMPNGIQDIGYGDADISALAAGAHAQQRLLQHSPRNVDEPALSEIYRAALRYW